MSPDHLGNQARNWVVRVNAAEAAEKCSNFSAAEDYTNLQARLKV